MPAVLTAFLSGLIFGLGLLVAQMVDPAKVLGFLDLFGSWDPSLAFVIAGAIAVMVPAVRVARGRLAAGRGAVLPAVAIQLPKRTDIDGPLLSGAVLFGLGWGLVGLCPAPALADLALAPGPAAVFVIAMVAGMVLHGLYTRGRATAKTGPEPGALAERMAEAGAD